ncbi:MAG: ATP synthase F1 subunit epsilon [Bacteroidetes bacterium GWF2_43_63]|nr:MAG: ATP synthase F1 subunit epsilon [Bacteroidetes bacterium GWE2_42_42]OFY55035.1 MAG: ATP synthase F1 subunit epsilon [Bacteroidetes bacterium GWF2_43_63]HBG69572.1 ATP synthase F1 subunit epsilon [Bacteroidales bacterium]HCB60689.1 ATP synthase F1 subunit epsilon [Bacteroidales bacterium]HCY24007.1 ATP synthase F1 subunit epsilon [Bacteroidales bacterium]
MRIEIVSPEKQLYAGEVSMAQFPGTEGSFQVLNNHAPMIATIGAGIIRVRTESGAEESIEVKGGIVEVQKNRILVLAE